ncbi:hypothetical protein [Marinoscillum sp. MHG1-6]|uniref:hypothetical protein n=1 Tax=Marinoscillum sp. MHG1-6 TaxID=2959627 RepID=UPI002157677B|nr:hypothetical protein [Marinoscillum sp. MHG1-6]
MKKILPLILLITLWSCDNKELQKENEFLKAQLEEQALKFDELATLAEQRTAEAIMQRNRAERYKHIAECENPEEHLKLLDQLNRARKEVEMAKKEAAKQAEIAEQQTTIAVVEKTKAEAARYAAEKAHAEALVAQNNAEKQAAIAEEQAKFAQAEVEKARKALEECRSKTN